MKKGKKIAVLASLILAFLLAGVLLLLQASPTEQETERTKYIAETYFAYLGSEENRPLENVVIALPAPHLENGFPPGDGVGADWSLWYIDENEEWKRQPFFAMHPQRTRMPQILKNVIGITPRGAKLWYCVDLLYPKEAFWVTGTTSSEKKVTLGDLDNNAKTSGIVGIRLSDGQELLDFDNALEFPIKGILWARLLKLVNGKPVVVEEFWRSVENVRGGTFRMYSIDVS